MASVHTPPPVPRAIDLPKPSNQIVIDWKDGERLANTSRHVGRDTRDRPRATMLSARDAPESGESRVG
jgi:hypothetical protein